MFTWQKLGASLRLLQACDRLTYRRFFGGLYLHFGRLSRIGIFRTALVAISAYQLYNLGRQALGLGGSLRSSRSRSGPIGLGLSGHRLFYSSAVVITGNYDTFVDQLLQER